LTSYVFRTETKMQGRLINGVMVKGMSNINITILY